MDEYDVAVIGGGPAGLSAALVLTRARRSVAVVDSGSPRNAAAAHMHGFLSRDGMPPAELLAVARAEVAGYGGHLLPDLATAIRTEADGFTVDLAAGTSIRARRLLVTTGLRDEIPDIPGLRDRWGKDVLHCPYCHGYEVRDQPLAVIGGSPEVVEHALLIRQWSADLTLFPHLDTLTEQARHQLSARGIGVEEGPVSHLAVDGDRLTGVVLADGRVVARAAVFVRPTLVPHADLLRDLGCDTDDKGLVTTDRVGRTSVTGVWAAGNAVNPRAQVITAAGEGSAAAIAINGDLTAADVHLAVRAFMKETP